MAAYHMGLDKVLERLEDTPYPFRVDVFPLNGCYSENLPGAVVVSPPESRSINQALQHLHIPRQSGFVGTRYKP